jgi:multidrug transporter EmrE-like cation transporter
MWILSSLIANLAIAVLEWNHRTSSVGWVSLSRAVPLIAVCQAALWYSWRTAPSVMVAWAILTFGNSLLRVVNTQFILGEPMTSNKWVALALISAGTFIMSWR